VRVQDARIPWARLIVNVFKDFKVMERHALTLTNAAITWITAVSMHTATTHLVHTIAPVFLVSKGMGKRAETWTNVKSCFINAINMHFAPTLRVLSIVPALMVTKETGGIARM